MTIASESEPLIGDLEQIISLLDEDKSNDWTEEIETLRRAVVTLGSAETDGTIHGAVQAVLRDRAEGRFFTEPAVAYEAIGWIEKNPDEFSERFADPMIDDLAEEAEARFMDTLS